MKFNKVQFNNFRQYIGENVIEFCSEDKNVTLIFGENGYGKTGIFRAIMFALYGIRYLKQDNLTKEEQREGLVLVNEKLLEENPNQDIEASVNLEFENADKKYSLTRTISARKIGDRIFQEPRGVSLIVTSNGNTQPPITDITEVSNIISSIINEKIKDFFLFDGEQIEELMKYSKESKEEIKSGIRTLLNLDAIEIAKDAFRKKLRELDREIELNSSGELEIVTEKLNEKNAILQNLEESIKTLKTDIEFARKQENQIERQINDNQEILTKQKDRNLIKEKIKETKNNLDGLKSKIKEYLSVSGPYLGQNIVSELYDDLDEKLEKGEIPNHIRKEFIDKLLKQCKCICGNDLNLHPEAREILLDYQRNYSDENSDTALNIYRTLAELKSKISIISNDVDRTIMSYDRYQEEIRSLEKTIEKYDEELKIDIPDLGGALQKIKNDLVRMHKELGQNETKQTNLTTEIKALSDKQEQLSLNDQKSRKIIAQKKILEKADEEMKKIYNEYSDELRTKLSDCATEIFKHIASKTTLDSLSRIVILDDFQLEVLSKNGTRMLQEISAGQKVVVSLSYIGAILQVGTNLEMPLLMDTPFGRLSSSPRAECIRILSGLLTQWILLATDTELQQEEATLLRQTGKWGKIYEIKHISDRQSRIEEKDITNWVPIKTTQRSI